MLAGIRPLLADGGRLVVTVPNAFSIKGVLRVLRGVEMVHPDHVAYFSSVTIGTLLSKCGYVLISHVYYTWRPAARWKRVLDTLILGPMRRYAPSLSEGLIVVARATNE